MKKTMIMKTALAMLLLLACGSNVEAQTQKRQVKKLAQSVKLSPSKAVSKQSADSVKEMLKAKEMIVDETPRNNGETVFDVVERMPEFAPCTYDITYYVRKDDQFVRETKTINNPGGQNGLMMFLNHNVKYPSIAEENGIQGRVICKFVVERDGSITEVKVAKSVDPSLDKEAVRVLKSMPKWIPGMQDGKPVRVQYTVPVTFKLQ